jgi:hypothetical protein
MFSMMRIDFQLACHVYNNIPRLPKLKRHPAIRSPAPRTSVIVCELLVEFWTLKTLIYVVVQPLPFMKFAERALLRMIGQILVTANSKIRS